MVTMTDQQLADLAYYLDDDLREAVHGDIAPCTPVEFVRACLERDRVLTLEAAELADVWRIVDAIEQAT